MQIVMASNKNIIQNQVRLPLSVALEVVLQGLRTRLGRSIVTITGVVLGIAFLMSILTGQLAREGVGRETQTRAEISRMLNFLVAETGPLKDRVIGVIQTGNRSPLEDRFLSSLADEGPKEVRWHSVQGAPALSVSTPRVEAGAVGQDASAILLIGDGGAPSLDWNALASGVRQRVFAATYPLDGQAINNAGTVIELLRQPRAEEIAKQEQDDRKAAFRATWIIIISLGVTVIGISNAMLMSVTERFREIGTMKCLGALSGFIRTIFLIESSLMGAVGGLAGTIVGAIFSIVAFGFTYGLGLVLSSMNWGLLIVYGLASLVAAVVLSIVAALYPANFASRMVPATALRTNI